jgi:hypothetical protein
VTAYINPFKFLNKSRVLDLAERNKRVSSVVHAENRVTKEKNKKWMLYAVDNDPVMISANNKTNKDEQGIPTHLPPTRGQTNSAHYARKEPLFFTFVRH